MPDISKCSGLFCPLKETCWRYTSEPSEYRQAYFMTPPYNKETKECDYYWKVEPKKIKHESNT